jgi:pyridoxamine 5'-phosphate oxidase
MDNPIEQIRSDWEKARKAGDPTANLCALSTVGLTDGRPRVRTLIMWDVTESGVVLLTNTTSPKWHELQRNPHFEVMILWTSIHKQYRLRGRVRDLPEGELQGMWAKKRYELKLLDHYYYGGPQQSAPVDRAEFLKNMADLEARYPESPPMPDSAKGLLLAADEIDVWNGKERFPERLLFVRTGAAWSTSNLAP